MVYLFSSSPRTIEEYFREENIEYKLIDKNTFKYFVNNYSPIRGDIGLVYDFGKFIPSKLLDQLPMLNIHFSLLPKYRGAIPVEAAILSGDTKTGISIQKMVPKMDEGPILLEKEVTIDSDWSAGELQKRMDLLLPDLLKQVSLENYEKMEFVEQEGESSYCYMKTLNKGNTELALNTLTKDEVLNKIRAYNPEPLAWIRIKKGRKETIANIYRAECFEGEIIGTFQFIKKKGLVLKVKDGNILVTQLVIAGQKVLENCDIVSLKGQFELS